MKPRRLLPACTALLIATRGIGAPPADPPPRQDPAGAKTPAPLVVEARLVDATPIPTLTQIQPYESALVVHTYQIVRVVDGTLTDPHISAAHWAIRGKRPVPTVPSRTNLAYRLTLKPFQACPELENERIVDTTERFDLLLYFAVQARPITPPDDKPAKRTGVRP